MTSGAYQQLMLCSLQGAIKHEHKEKLIQRLYGISVSSISIRQHEMCYRSPAVQALNLPANELRFRVDLNTNQWTVVYFGTPIGGEKITAQVRPIVEVETSENAPAFFEGLGFHFEFEFLREGLLWKSRNNVTTTITSIKHMPVAGDRENAVPVGEGISLVECSMLSNDERLAETQEELQSFVDQLVPLVEMARPDGRAIQAASVATAKAPPRMHSASALHRPMLP